MTRFATDSDAGAHGQSEVRDVWIDDVALFADGLHARRTALVVGVHLALAPTTDSLYRALATSVAAVLATSVAAAG